MTDPAMPVVFHFTVAIAGLGGSEDAAFSEASGLEAEIETETVIEGGENRFAHKLPKPVKHPNLVLRRGVASKRSGLTGWVTSTLERDLSQPIQPKAIVVSLCDAEGAPVCSWSLANAWPVKWSIAGFDARKNEVAIESLEMAYTTLKRTA